MKFFISISLFFFCSLRAEIIEVERFEEILNYASTDSLVLLDIDDTILIPEQMLGCDEWFCSLLKEFQKEEISNEDALHKALNAWLAIRHLTKMKLVEETTDSIIALMQSQKIPVMGLTTQGFVLAEKTSYQLANCNVFLYKTAPYQEDMYFMQHVGRGDKKVGILYHQGILFTNGTNKGESFLAFCEKTVGRPRKIIFINDKRTHLRELEKSLEQNGIEFIGLRYSFSDSFKKSFCFKTAQHQFEQVPYLRILSDEEARQNLGLVN